MNDTVNWASTLDELDALSVMHVTLESGARVLAGTVTLDELIADEALPDDLLFAAVLDAANETVPEMVREVRSAEDGHAERVRGLARDRIAVHDRLALRSLRKGGYPDGQADEVFERLDAYDRQLLAHLAQRRVNVDAAGRRFGAETLAQFRGADPEPPGDQAGETLGGEGVDVPDVQP